MTRAAFSRRDGRATGTSTVDAEPRIPGAAEGAEGSSPPARPPASARGSRRPAAPGRRLHPILVCRMSPPSTDPPVLSCFEQPVRVAVIHMPS